MSKSIYGAYDVRGIYPADINENIVKQIGSACTTFFESGKVVIAHDGRHGSESLAEAVEQGILAQAKKDNKTFSIELVGLATTPMFYFLVNKLEASGGMMITASHNPKEYNGVKAVGVGAVPISGIDIEARLKTI